MTGLVTLVVTPLAVALPRGIPFARLRYAFRLLVRNTRHACDYFDFVKCVFLSQNTKARMAEIFPVKSASFLLDFASCSAATALCSVMSTPQVIQIVVGRSQALGSFKPIVKCTHLACVATVSIM